MLPGPQMIIKTPELEEFYRRLIVEEDLSYEQALRIFESLYAEALTLGAITEENILDGLETDLRIAKALNGLKP
jgi:hypothetical protein